MKIVDHTNENLQHGKFNLEDIQFIEQNHGDNAYVITLKTNDQRPEVEVHYFRSGCTLIPERNFHTMFLIVG